MTEDLGYNHLDFTNDVYATTTAPYYTYTINVDDRPTRTIRYTTDATGTVRIDSSGITGVDYEKVLGGRFFTHPFTDPNEYEPIQNEIEPEELDMLYGDMEDNE